MNRCTVHTSWNTGDLQLQDTVIKQTQAENIGNKQINLLPSNYGTTCYLQSISNITGNAQPTPHQAHN